MCTKGTPTDLLARILVRRLDVVHFLKDMQSVDEGVQTRLRFSSANHDYPTKI